MPIFDSNKSGTATFARGYLANRVGNPGTVAQAVTDGDTIRVRLPGGQGLRLLGCDTPEKKIEFRKSGFVALNDPRWTAYFKTVWNTAKWGAFDPPLPDGLKSHLKKKLKDDAALNQWNHALAATKSLAELVEGDRKAFKLPAEKFRVFAAFSHEILDRYGRPLVFANIDVKEPVKRPELYNARMIANGRATPFFMWPNIEPFRKMKITEAALPPKEMHKELQKAKKLQAARKLAAAARQKGLGIYDKNKPLQLHAFELRYLARRAAPDRWVIDIGDNAGGSKLVRPGQYHTIAHPEDRLFIPAEYVPLFMKNGWT